MIEKLNVNKIDVDNLWEKQCEIIDWINGIQLKYELSTKDAQSPRPKFCDHGITLSIPCKKCADTRKGCGKEVMTARQGKDDAVHCGDTIEWSDAETIHFCEDCNAQHILGINEEKQGKDNSNAKLKSSQPALCKCGHIRDRHYDKGDNNWCFDVKDYPNSNESCFCEKFEVRHECQEDKVCNCK